jgi:adenylyl cyclase-associated protein
MDETPLIRLIHRLEAATSRLEDIASSAQPFEPSATGHDGSSLAVPSQNQRASTPGASSIQSQEPLPESIEDFDTLINGDLKAYNDLSQALGGVIAEQVIYL